MVDNTYSQNKTRLKELLKAAVVFIVGGSFAHIFVMLIDYYLMPAGLQINMQSDVVSSLLELAMLPMTFVYGVCLLGVYFFWKKAKNAMELACNRDTQRREAEHVVRAIQRITGILAEHLSTHNSEIVFWVERRKQQVGSAPACLEQSSSKIAGALTVLSEISFVMPYMNNRIQTVKEIETILLNKLNDRSQGP